MTPEPSESPRADYHHGNLPVALVAAARRIVQSQGVDALSLRAVAREAKVSHGAPYHHFAGKAEMLAAVATEGFDAMVAAIQAEQSLRPADDFRGRVVAVGTAYVTFAREFPAIFRLMFRPELTRPSVYPPLQEAEARTFGTLVEAIAACQASGDLPGADPLPAALACWSAVHGFSLLWIEGVIAETPLGAQPFEQLALELMGYIMRGVSAPPP